MDEQGLRDAEAEVLAEQGQGEGEGAGEHGETREGAEGEAKTSRFQQRISQLVAERQAAVERAETAERATLEARAAAETAERIARERQGRPEAERPPSLAERRELVKRQFRAGEIDDDMRVERLADLAAEERLVQADQLHDARRILQSTADEIDGWKRLAPELVQPNSQIRGRVQEHFKRLVDRGYSANDIRTELLAVEQVMGGTLSEHQRRRSVDDFTADQTPRGGVGTGSAGAERPRSQGGQDNYGAHLFSRLVPEALAEMRRLYAHMPEPDAAIKKDLEYADEETLWRRGRLKSR